MTDQAKYRALLWLLALLVFSYIGGMAQTHQNHEQQRIDHLQVELSARVSTVRSLSDLRVTVTVANTGKQDFALGDIFTGARLSIAEPGKAERLCDAPPINYQWSNAGGPPLGYRFLAGETYRSTLLVKNIHCGSISSTDISMRVRICVVNCIKVTSINGKPAGPEWETGEPIYIYSNWLPVRVGSK
jgi:hypothetical protein